MASKPKVMLDDDVPELTAAELAEFRPAREIMPAAEFEAVSSVRRGRPRGATKEAVTLRVDVDLLAAFKASGKGWQTKMNAALREGAKSMPAIFVTKFDPSTGEDVYHSGSPEKGRNIVRVANSSRYSDQPKSKPASSAKHRA